jgi:hypothetical protein
MSLWKDGRFSLRSMRKSPVSLSPWFPNRHDPEAMQIEMEKSTSSQRIVPRLH